MLVVVSEQQNVLDFLYSFRHLSDFSSTVSRNIKISTPHAYKYTTERTEESFTLKLIFFTKSRTAFLFESLLPSCTIIEFYRVLG